MQPEAAPATRRAVFHFIDGSKLGLEWPQQMPEGSRELAAALREAAATAQFAVEADGKVLILQMTNVKYLELTPAPTRLPLEWLRGARQVEVE